MDFNDDGVQDLISGSYDPGSVFLFKGLGQGKYADRLTLEDERGTPLVTDPEAMRKFLALDDERSSKKWSVLNLRAANFGSFPAMVDYDDDGDLDMLIGSFGGGIALRENIGTRCEPVFSHESSFLKTGKRYLKVAMHANPVVADWDSDSLWDLVVAASNGSVVWFRNTGTIGKPEFARRKLLVRSGHSDLQKLNPMELPKQGVRAQICVADFNEDGKLDLLLGDYSTIEQKKELDDESKKELGEILNRIEELKKTFENVAGNLDSHREPSESVELEAKYQKAREEYTELVDAQKQFYQHDGIASFVWYFQRK